MVCAARWLGVVWFLLTRMGMAYRKGCALSLHDLFTQFLCGPLCVERENEGDSERERARTRAFQQEARRLERADVERCGFVLTGSGAVSGT